jgi:hypothetical protein
MGFFSWKTQDTKRSICNTYSSRPTFTVIMTDDKMNQWIETDYEGYGVFGGKDYHELLDEMNGGSGDRSKGISIAFGEDKKNYIFPSLSENGSFFGGVEPSNCSAQGYFYD